MNQYFLLKKQKQLKGDKMNLRNMYAQYCWNLGTYWYAIYIAWEKFLRDEMKNE